MDDTFNRSAEEGFDRGFQEEIRALIRERAAEGARNGGGRVELPLRSLKRHIRAVEIVEGGREKP